jgi:Raptor N-terminal CASPase like domain
MLNDREPVIVYAQAQRAPYLYDDPLLRRSNRSNAIAANNAANNSDGIGATSASSNNADMHGASNEADAAAGMIKIHAATGALSSQPLPAVASFSLLPRSPSTPALRARQLGHINQSSNALVSIAATSAMNLAGLVVGGGANTEAAALTANDEANANKNTSKNEGTTNLTNSSPIIPDWRCKDRMKTVGIGLVLALNIGTDPPDVYKPNPCAVLQTWLDPRSVSRSHAKEWVADRLEHQYAKWQLARTARPLKVRKAVDPTVEEVRAVCLGLRRQARNERVLWHYNGMGVPRPTANGELWVFDKNHTEYIPLSIVDIRQWLGKPSIVSATSCSYPSVRRAHTLPSHSNLFMHALITLTYFPFASYLFIFTRSCWIVQQLVSSFHLGQPL